MQLASSQYKSKYLLYTYYFYFHRCQKGHNTNNAHKNWSPNLKQWAKSKDNGKGQQYNQAK